MKIEEKLRNDLDNIMQQLHAYDNGAKFSNENLMMLQNKRYYILGLLEIIEKEKNDENK